MREAVKKRIEAADIIFNQKLDHIEKDRIAMVARLAMLVSKKRADFDKASKKHLKGRVLGAEELLTSFVVGGYNGSAGGYDIETRIRPSMVGRKSAYMLGVLRKDKALAAIRTHDNAINPVILMVPNDILEKILIKFCKAYLVVPIEILKDYLKS